MGIDPTHPKLLVREGKPEPPKPLPELSRLWEAEA